MNKYFTLLALVILTAITSIQAQTNVSPVTPVTLSLDKTNTVEKSDQWAKELTLGGAGVTTTHGNTTFGLDVSFSIQPLKLPIWVEVSQNLAWEPQFSGSTDLDAAWAFNLYHEKVYLNVGWFGGVVYDQHDYFTRTGPQACLQYYLTDNVFIYGQLNWDAFVSGENEKGLRESFGLGFAF